MRELSAKMLKVVLLLSILTGALSLPGQKIMNKEQLRDALMKAKEELNKRPRLEASLTNPSKIKVEQAREHVRQYTYTSSYFDIPDDTKMLCNATEGEILMTFPEKCLQLTCRQGFVTPLYAFEEDHCNCCEHNGKLYKEGDELPGVCQKMFCCDGQWVDSGYINDCCKSCDAYGGAHIATFDARSEANNWYTFTSHCNYTLTQKLEDNNQGTYYTEYGVHVLFGTCWDYSSSSACVDTITFKNDHHTVVEIYMSHLEATWVNGHQIFANYSVPTNLVDGSGHQTGVLMWSGDYGCRKLLGSQGIMLQVCPHYVRVFAHESLYNEIGGLCGYFNDYDQDDHMTRAGTIMPVAYYPEFPSQEFVASWLTEHYDYCYQNDLNPQGAPDPFVVATANPNSPNGYYATRQLTGHYTPTSFGYCYNQNITQSYYEQCRKAIAVYIPMYMYYKEHFVDSYTEACFFDLCSFGGTYADSIIYMYDMLAVERALEQPYHNGFSVNNPCGNYQTTTYSYTTCYPSTVTSTITSFYPQTVYQNCTTTPWWSSTSYYPTSSYSWSSYSSTTGMTSYYPTSSYTWSSYSTTWSASLTSYSSTEPPRILADTIKPTKTFIGFPDFTGDIQRIKPIITKTVN